MIKIIKISLFFSLLTLTVSNNAMGSKDPFQSPGPQTHKPKNIPIKSPDTLPQMRRLINDQNNGRLASREDMCVPETLTQEQQDMYANRLSELQASDTLNQLQLDVETDEDTLEQLQPLAHMPDQLTRAQINFLQKQNQNQYEMKRKQSITLDLHERIKLQNALLADQSRTIQALKERQHILEKQIALQEQELKKQRRQLQRYISENKKELGSEPAIRTFARSASSSSLPPLPKRGTNHQE